MPADGMVRIQATRMRRATPQRTARAPWLAPTPMIALPEAGAIAVNYTAGYGAAGVSVPQGIISWMLLRIGMLYEHREQVADGQLTPLPHVDGLLDPYRVPRA